MRLDMKGEVKMSGEELAERMRQIKHIEEMTQEDLEDIEEIGLGDIDFGEVFKPDSPTGCCSASSCCSGE